MDEAISLLEESAKIRSNKEINIECDKKLIKINYLISLLLL